MWGNGFAKRVVLYVFLWVLIVSLVTWVLYSCLPEPPSHALWR
jgi:hypothetical protein